MSDTKKSGPVAKIAIVPVTAAIQRDVTEKGALYSVTYECKYRDNEGKLQSTDAYSGTDNLILAKVADMAHTKIEELRANDCEAAKAEG